MTPTLVLALVVLSGITRTESACTIPALFRNTQWVDNAKGDISFTTWKMSGWSVEVEGQIVDEWEIVDNVKFDDEGYLALRSSGTFNVSGTTYYSYVCMKFERVSVDIYKYFTLHDRNPLANNNNVKTVDHDDLTRFDEICDLTYTRNYKLFGVFVRSGMKPSVTCPNPILVNFKYEVALPNGTVVCTPDQTRWKGCNNIRNVELMNSSCNYPVAYSESGKLNCIASGKNLNDPDVTSVVLMNTDDTVDNIITFRFACLMAKDDGTEMVISPRECHPDQTPAQFPMDRDGNEVGHRIQTSKANTDSDCRFVPDDGEDDPILSTPAIVGIVVGSISLIVIIIGIICCCRKRD